MSYRRGILVSSTKRELLPRAPFVPEWANGSQFLLSGSSDAGPRNAIGKGMRRGAGCLRDLYRMANKASGCSPVPQVLCVTVREPDSRSVEPHTEWIEIHLIAHDACVDVGTLAVGNHVNRVTSPRVWTAEHIEHALRIRPAPHRLAPWDVEERLVGIEGGLVDHGGLAGSRIDSPIRLVNRRVAVGRDVDSVWPPKRKVDCGPYGPDDSILVLHQIVGMQFGSPVVVGDI